MAAQTVQFDVAPIDGWTLVATNPNSIVIRAHDPVSWRVFVGANPPLDTDQGLPMLPGDAFSSSSITGVVYVRAIQPSGRLTTGATRFGVMSS